MLEIQQKMKLVKCLPFRDLIFLWEERSMYEYVVRQMVMSAMEEKEEEEQGVLNRGCYRKGCVNM